MIKKFGVGLTLASMGLLSVGTIPSFADETNSEQEEYTIEIVESREEILKELQEEYGKENKFYLEYEDNKSKEEINPVTGKVKNTDKQTGQVEEYDIDEIGSDFQPLTREEILKELQEEYGKENKFYLFYEDNESKEEINPVTGKVKSTDKQTGHVEEYDVYDN
ncbi:hypothetical protein B834_2720 [Enterococcus mundtii 1A]|uniref:hypothetical protein n=1 Tax=Enterococcus mundtii TaxID=53346 RepID=UPI0023026466|nr:hypothetical protein [Enterococcus mundtii]MDA9430188.1 hypothetical protein [Enterococcus mundtii 1A]